MRSSAERRVGAVVSAAIICIYSTSFTIKYEKIIFLVAFKLIYEIYLLFCLYLPPINRTKLHLSFLCCAKNLYGLRSYSRNFNTS